MTISDDALTGLAQWWAELETYKGNNGLPAKGTVAGALVVLGQLREDYELDIAGHTAKGGSQIKGLGGQAIKRALAEFGETRRFAEEGGRTNRGARAEIQSLLTVLADLRLEDLSGAERNAVLLDMQKWLMGKVAEYFNRSRIQFAFAPERSTWHTVADILAEARAVGKEGPVAQYLVGAKLALRFPEVEVRNDSYSTSDAQSGLPGDFVIRGTAFHVTVAPMPHLYAKVSANARQGYRVYVLTPDHWVVGARQNAEAVAPGRIKVESIESFVSQNLDELTTFAPDAPAQGLRQLLTVYNTRVDAVETDKSLLIELPRNLVG